MKRKVEKYLYSKNIDGVHRLKDHNDRYLIGDDLEGCLRAARSGPNSHLKSAAGRVNSSEPTPLSIKVGARKSATTPGSAQSASSGSTGAVSSQKKRKLNSLFSPAVAPRKKTTGGSVRKGATSRTPSPSGPTASAKDRKELMDFCRTLRGGYDVNGIYRSAIERRKMTEGLNTCTGSSLNKALNALNMTVDERSRLPAFFKVNVAKLLDEYKAPPTKEPSSVSRSSSIGGGGVLASARKPSAQAVEPPTPFHLGFDDMAATATGIAKSPLNPLNKVLLQPQLRPSPVTSKTQRESLETVVFNPFSPATKKMMGVPSNELESSTAAAASVQAGVNFDLSAKTPERVRAIGEGIAPGSAFSSFSPFISPNYMDSVMGQGMTMTPAIAGSAQHSLTAPPSWKSFDSKMLNETFNSFSETPSRKLDAFLEATGTGPTLPTTAELARHQTKLPEDSSDESDMDNQGGVPIINTTFSFSDVLVSPEEEQTTAHAVTDSGPLRMRLKSNNDLSTHHFDTWGSPTCDLSQELVVALKGAPASKAASIMRKKPKASLKTVDEQEVKSD